jgi:cold shock protein
MSTLGLIEVFLSYNHHDEWIAKWLADELGKSGVKVWIDQEGMRTGDNIYDRVAAEITESQFFLALMTENSVKSDWVKTETAIAVERYKQHKLVILPVRVGSVRVPESLREFSVLELDLGSREISIGKLVRDIRSLYKERFGHRPAEKPVARGTVKWFNDARGFGFITQDDEGEDVFAHHGAINADGFRILAEGQKVEFDVTKGPKGLKAANKRVIS